MRVHLAILGAAVLAGTAGCDSTGPDASGAVQAAVSTTGGDLDIDGYQLMLDGAIVATIETNASAHVDDVHIGSHDVELVGIAPNCTVTGNPRSVAVNQSQTTRVEFSIACVATGISVSLAATGFDFGSGEYQLTIDAAPAAAIQVGGTASATRLTAGAHSVGLSPAPPPNCTTTPALPLAVSVTTDIVTPVTLGMACSAVTGVAMVSAVTTGVDLDTDGYTVTVDGQFAHVLRTNPAVSFPGLEPGVHEVTLSGIADNCAAAGGPSHPFSLVAGGTKPDSVHVDFQVTCTEIPRSVRVITVTSGSMPDNAYTVSVDGEYCWYYYCDELDIAANDNIGFDLPAGTHTLRLDGIAVNCTLAGPNPVTITVAPGATTTVTFSLDCPPPGTLRVTAPTTGADLDQFYSVYLDDRYLGQLYAPGSLELPAAAVSHVVRLDDMTGNCTVGGANPATAPVTITSGNLSEVTFPVVCAPYPVLSITLTTTGTNPDASYLIGVDADWYYGGYLYSKTVPANGVALISLPPGQHFVHLTDVASNCSSFPPSPVTVDMPMGSAVSIAFGVLCQ